MKTKKALIECIHLNIPQSFTNMLGPQLLNEFNEPCKKNHAN